MCVCACGVWRWSGGLEKGREGWRASQGSRRGRSVGRVQTRGAQAKGAAIHPRTYMCVFFLVFGVGATSGGGRPTNPNRICRVAAGLSSRARDFQCGVSAMRGSTRKYLECMRYAGR